MAESIRKQHQGGFSLFLEWNNFRVWKENKTNLKKKGGRGEGQQTTTASCSLFFQ